MLEIGQIIDGKYKILNVIGQGGMSVVYLAMNERANKQWAIKEVRKDGKQDFDVVKQGLVAEIDMLKRFNHPNLPSIVDVIDGDGTFLIVMDYIEGNALDKRLQEEGAQNQDDVIEWSKQLCDVLGYLHSRKPPIIYRDMKPSNVMLKPDGTVTLIDFGTAREFKSSSVADTTCLGTRGYAAPEQFGGQGQTDPRTDIYCLGATMYHLVTGHNPGAYPYKMYPIRQWNSLLSSGLEAIILKCTQQNPTERYQSCAELMYALEHYHDLDIESVRVQNIKWKTFIAAACICMVTAVGAVTFRTLEAHGSTDMYARYIYDASHESKSDDAFKLFKKAIKLKPENPEAYKAMLIYINEDEKLDSEENRQLEMIKNDLYEFKGANPESYSLFCYDVALSYYFDYQDESDEGARLSQTWFKDVNEDMLEYAGNAEGREDASSLKEKNRIISKMSEFKFNDSGRNARGDSDYDFRQYWNDYVSLIDKELERTENVKVALSVYKRFTATIIAWASEFETAVGLEEIKREFDLLESKLNDVPRYSTYSNLKDDSTISDIRLQMNQAYTAVENAANQIKSNNY